jgi:hypothetical protein
VERRSIERSFGRDEAIERLRSGAYSTMRLLPPAELADGIRRAPELLPDPVRYESGLLIVEAER